MALWITIIFVILLTILVVTSALFSFSEMAISSTNKARVNSIIYDKETSGLKKKQAKRVIKFVKNYNQYISAIVIFNNIVNILFSTLSVVFFTAILHEIGPLVSFLVATPIVIIFGEIVPKQLAKKYPESGTMRLSFLLVLVNYLMLPITALLKKIIKEEEQATLGSDHEITMALQEATAHGVTTSFEEQLIKRSLDIDNMKIKDVMISLKQAGVMKGKITEAKINNLLNKKPYTRFPLLDTKGNVKSIFSAKKYLVDSINNKITNFDDYLFDFATLELDDNPYHAFELLRNRREKMAVVVDDNEKFVGLITVEDVVELMLGNIYDENDVEEDGVYALSETSFVVNPNVKVGHLKENYIKSLKTNEEQDKQTINKFIQTLAGKKIKAGDHYTFKNVIVWVIEDKEDESKINFEIDIVQ